MDPDPKPSRLDRIFPLWRVRNVAIFYILSSVYNMWFLAGVWIFIWGKFMTKTQIGLSDGLTFAVGFLIELPSGVFADLIGRRKAILIGNVLLTVGNFFVAVSSSFWGITLWYLIWTIGYAFQSGATEALAYDSVKKIGQADKWPKIIATSSIIGRTTSLTATAIGGFLYAAWFRLPYLAFAATGVIGVVAAYLLHEIPVTIKPNLWSPKTYLRQIKEGLFTIIRPQVLPISLLSLTIAGMAYMYNWGLLRPLTGDRFGFSPVTLPFLLSTVSLVVIFATLILLRLRHRFNLDRLLLIFGAIYSVLFLVMGFPHGWLVGGLIMIFLAVFAAYVDQLFSQFINLHTREEHRATTLSAIALFTRAPYVFLAILIGAMAQRNLLPQFTTAVGVIALVIWFISLLKFRNISSPHTSGV